MIEWQDQALVLSARAFSDSDALVTVLTQGRGRVAGLVRGGQSRRRRADLQIGTLVQVMWRARLEDHLGTFTLEVERSFVSAYLDDRPRLSALEAFSIMAQQTLGEREPVPGLFQATLTWLDYLGEDFWPQLYVKLELSLLAALGFSADFSACALGGAANDLAYVSPRTGRAVSSALAEPYKDKLLPLPAFLGGAQNLGDQELNAGLGLSGHLLTRHVFGALNRDLPAVRHRLAKLLFVPEPIKALP